MRRPGDVTGQFVASPQRTFSGHGEHPIYAPTVHAKHLQAIERLRQAEAGTYDQGSSGRGDRDTGFRGAPAWDRNRRCGSPSFAMCARSSVG